MDKEHGKPSEPAIDPDAFLKELASCAEDMKETVRLSNKRLDWMVSFMAMTDRFFFEVLGRMERIPTFEIDTMAVGPRGVMVALYYNPFFMSELSDDELRWVLTHEVGHVVLHHITLRKPSDPHESNLMNWAADLAVNSLFPQSNGFRYPVCKKDVFDEETKEQLCKAGEPWVLLPKKFGFPERQSMEQYAELLRNAVKKGKIPKAVFEDGASGGNSNGNGRAGRQFDVHYRWGQNPAVDAQVREWVEQLRKTTSWGTLRGEVQAAILAAQKSEVPWNKVLRYYYGLISSKQRVSTYKRPSRRFGYPWCGKKPLGTDRKLVAIDTSGSVSTKELEKFMAETNALAETQPVDVITWDAGLTMPRPIQWSGKKRSFDFAGRGGTDPQPVLDFARERNYREVIMLTDGGFGTPKVPAGLDALWVITPEGSPSHLPQGSRVVLMKSIT